MGRRSDSLEEIFQRLGYGNAKRVGKGMSGSVYQVSDLEKNRTLAIKVLDLDTQDQSLRERFRQEALLLAEQPHPAIVKIYGIHLEQEPPCLALQWMPGGDLATQLEKNGAFSNAAVAAMGQRLNEGLAHLHKNGILHRDVKLANILLDENLAPCLADLGLAKSDRSQELTSTGAVVGTPLYMSPEVLRAGEYSQESDRFALAASLFELVRGRPLEKLASYSEWLQAELKELKDPRLQKFFYQTLHPSKERRPSNAAEFSQALAKIRLENTGSSMRQHTRPAVVLSDQMLPRPPEKSSPPKRGSMRIPLFLGGVFSLLCLILLWNAQPKAGPSPQESPVSQETAGNVPVVSYYQEEAAQRKEILANGLGLFRNLGPVRDLKKKEFDEGPFEKSLEAILDPVLILRWRRYLRSLTPWLGKLAARTGSPAPEGLEHPSDPEDFHQLVKEQGHRFVLHVKRQGFRAEKQLTRGSMKIGMEGMKQMNRAFDVRKELLKEARVLLGQVDQEGLLYTVARQWLLHPLELNLEPESLFQLENHLRLNPRSLHFPEGLKALVMGIHRELDNPDDSGGGVQCVDLKRLVLWVRELSQSSTYKMLPIEYEHLALRYEKQMFLMLMRCTDLPTEAFLTDAETLATELELGTKQWNLARRGFLKAWNEYLSVTNPKIETVELLKRFNASKRLYVR